MYAEAESLYERSLVIREEVLGRERPDAASSLSNWAGLLKEQGKYEEVGPLYECSVAIREKSKDLIILRGKFGDADPLYVRVLEIVGAAVGEEHPNYALALSNRVGLLESQGKYDEVDPLYLLAIKISEKTLGHPDLATKLNNRAGLL
eukprot:g15719.t2